MPKVLFQLFACLPLPIIHGLGVILGWLAYLTDKRFAGRVLSNLSLVNIAKDQASQRKLTRLCIQETGKGLLESLAIWFRSPDSALKWVKACVGWEHVEKALADKNGIIFLTPHLGCFEITARYYASNGPISVLFKPARKSWMADIIEAGRSHSQIKLAPTSMRGIRSLFKALRNGEAIGILPDQVPDEGDGVWASFFEQPAYTMTLVSKLAEASKATVLVAFGERLAWGRGYIIHIEPLGVEATPQNINDAIERLVRTRPEQYLWSYGRFKQPRQQTNPPKKSAD
ncbi:MAG TPA: lysophospholipid acyltransferase family protein [Methylophilaceae bacterium]|jgi:KDO2-lipid IV(A) lauroyltransferase